MKRAILLLALISAPAGAQTWSENGLETANYKYVAVVIENLGTDAHSIGLTEDRIRTHVELRLRSVGLRPGKDVRKNKAWLYVNIDVLASAFNIHVSYQREVGFTAGNRSYRHHAIAWKTVGHHGISVGNAAFIINALDIRLDEFLNEYLKINQK